MSYSGTVRCSYCYEQGHNRLGCPRRRKEALKNPDSYEGKRWHREQEQRKQAIESRVCSYCKQPGHNRRGCPVLKEDKALIMQRQKEYVESFAHVTSSAGLGTGALVKIPTARPHAEGGSWSKWVLAFITGVNWENVDFLIQDTNLTRGWRDKERELFHSRVVATHGYPEDEENYWNSPPKFNDVYPVKLHQLRELLKPILHEGIDFHDETTDGRAVVESPAPTPLSIPHDAARITEQLNYSFHLNPQKGADSYDKERTGFWREHWSKIREDEYEPRTENKGW